MLGVNLVSAWNKIVVPAVVSGLIAADQQNRNASRIEGKKCAVWASAMLGSQLLHVRMLRSSNQVDMWTSQAGSTFAEKIHAGSNVFLFRLAQGIPPRLELVGEFNFPCHLRNITYEECCCQESRVPHFSRSVREVG